MSAVAWTEIKNALHTMVRVGSGLAASRIRWGGQNAPEPEGTSLPWITLRITQIQNPGKDWVAYDPNPLAFDPLPLTLDATADTGTSAAHKLVTLDGPVRVETSGSLTGTGLETATDYWVIREDDDTLKFALSFLDAKAGVFVDITGTGTGTHSLVAADTTVRAGQELRAKVRGGRRVTLTVTCFPPQPTASITPQSVSDASEAMAILSDVATAASLPDVSDAVAAANIGILQIGDPQSIDGILNAVYFEPRATMTVVFTTGAEFIGSTAATLAYVNGEYTTNSQAMEIPGG